MFIIVRHGNTFAAGDPPRRIGARTDIGLTETGQEQAQALGKFFAERGLVFGQILTSPLLRTRQTAQAILAGQGLTIEPQVADFLREVDHGPDENRTEREVQDRIGAAALAAWDADGVAPPDWVIDRQMRIDAWRDLFASGSQNDRPHLLVTSNGAARFALLATKELQEAARHLPSLKMPTGSYSVIRPGNLGGLVIDGWGLRP